MKDSYQGIQDDLLNQHIKTLGRESLLKRSDILHAVSRPTDASLSKNIFSREQLENGDRLRHEIVHKLAFHKEIKNVGDVLTSIQKMGVYFVILVGTTHSVLMCKDAKALAPHLNPDLGKLVTAISDFNDLKNKRMKVTLNWLKQYVDFNWSPEELIGRLAG